MAEIRYSQFYKGIVYFRRIQNYQKNLCHLSIHTGNRFQIFCTKSHKSIRDSYCLIIPEQEFHRPGGGTQRRRSPDHEIESPAWAVPVLGEGRGRGAPYVRLFSIMSNPWVVSPRCHQYRVLTKHSFVWINSTTISKPLRVTWYLANNISPF